MSSKPRSIRPSAQLIRTGNEAEMRYWASVFEISMESLQFAVQIIGTDAGDVRGFVERSRGRPLPPAGVLSSPDRGRAIVALTNRIAELEQEARQMQQAELEAGEGRPAAAGATRSSQSLRIECMFYQTQLEALCSDLGGHPALPPGGATLEEAPPTRESELAALDERIASLTARIQAAEQSLALLAQTDADVSFAACAVMNTWQLLSIYVDRRKRLEAS